MTKPLMTLVDAANGVNDQWHTWFHPKTKKYQQQFHTESISESIRRDVIEKGDG